MLHISKVHLILIILNIARRSVRVLALPADYSNNTFLQSQPTIRQDNASKADHAEATEDDIENFKTLADDYKDFKLNTVFNNKDSELYITSDGFVPIKEVNHFRINLQKNCFNDSSFDKDVISESEIITNNKHFNGNASVVYISGTGKDIFDLKEKIQRHGAGHELLVYLYIFRNMKYYYFGHLITDMNILRDCLSSSQSFFCMDIVENDWCFNNLNHSNKNYLKQVGMINSPTKVNKGEAQRPYLKDNLVQNALQDHYMDSDNNIEVQRVQTLDISPKTNDLSSNLYTINDNFPTQNPGAYVFSPSKEYDIKGDNTSVDLCQKHKGLENNNTNISLNSNNSDSIYMIINNAPETVNKQNIKEKKEKEMYQMKTHNGLDDMVAPTSTLVEINSNSDGIANQFPSRSLIEEDIHCNVTNYEIPVDKSSEAIKSNDYNFNVNNDNAVSKDDKLTGLKPMDMISNGLYQINLQNDVTEKGVPKNSSLTVNSKSSPIKQTFFTQPLIKDDIPSHVSIFSSDSNSPKKIQTLDDTIKLDQNKCLPCNLSGSYILDHPLKKEMEGNAMVFGAYPNGNLNALETRNLKVNTGVNGNTRMGSYIMNLDTNKAHKDIYNKELYNTKQSPKTNYIDNFPYHELKLPNNKAYPTQKNKLQIMKHDGVIMNANDNYKNIWTTLIPTDAKHNVRHMNKKYLNQINLKPGFIPATTGSYPSDYIMRKVQVPKNEATFNQNSLSNILCSTEQRTLPMMNRYVNLFSRSENGMDAERIKNRNSDKWYVHNIPESMWKTYNYFNKNKIAIKNLKSSIGDDMNQLKDSLLANGNVTGRENFKSEKQTEQLKPLSSLKCDNFNLLNPFYTKSRLNNKVKIYHNPPFLTKQHKPSYMNYDENFGTLTQCFQIPKKEFNSSKVPQNNHYISPLHKKQNFDTNPSTYLIEYPSNYKNINTLKTKHETNQVNYYRPTIDKINSRNNFYTNKLHELEPTSKTLFNQNIFEGKRFPIQQDIKDYNINNIPSRFLTPKHPASVISMPFSTEITKPTIRYRSDAYKNVTNIKPIFNIRYYSPGINNYNSLPYQLILRDNSRSDIFNKNKMSVKFKKLLNSEKRPYQRAYKTNQFITLPKYTHSHLKIASVSPGVTYYKTNPPQIVLSSKFNNTMPMSDYISPSSYFPHQGNLIITDPIKKNEYSEIPNIRYISKIRERNKSLTSSYSQNSRSHLHSNIMNLPNPFTPRPVRFKNYITPEQLYKTRTVIQPISDYPNIFPSSGVQNVYSHKPVVCKPEYWPNSKSTTSSFAQRGYSYLPFKNLIQKRFDNKLFSLNFQKNKISKSTPGTSKRSQVLSPFVTQTSYITKSIPQNSSPSWPLPFSKHNWNPITTSQGSSNPLKFVKSLPCKTSSLGTKKRFSLNNLLYKNYFTNLPQNINFDHNTVAQNAVMFQSNAYPMLLPSAPCQSYLEAIPMVQSAKSLINQIPSKQPLLESSSVIKPHGSISNKTGALISGPNIALTKLEPSHSIQREISIPNINFYNYYQKPPITFFKKSNSLQSFSNMSPNHRKGSSFFKQSPKLKKQNYKIEIPKNNFNSMDLMISKYFTKKMPVITDSYKPNSPFYTNPIQSKADTLIQNKIFSTPLTTNNIALPCRYVQGVQPLVCNAVNTNLGYYTNSKGGIILKPFINPLLPNNMIAFSKKSIPETYKYYESPKLYRNSYNSPLKRIAPSRNVKFHNSPVPRAKTSNLSKKLQKITSYRTVLKPERLTNSKAGTTITNYQLISIPRSIFPSRSSVNPYRVPGTNNSLLSSNLFLPHVQRFHSPNPAQSFLQPSFKNGAYILSAPTLSYNIKTSRTPLEQLNSQKAKFSNRPRGQISYKASIFSKPYPSNLVATNAESGLLNNARRKIERQETTNFYTPQIKIPNIVSYKRTDNYKSQAFVPRSITKPKFEIISNLNRQSLIPLSSTIGQTSNILPSMISLNQNAPNLPFNMQNINNINLFRKYTTTPYNKEKTYDLIVNSKPSPVQVFIDKNNQNIGNNINLFSKPKYVNDYLKNINYKSITKPNIVIAKYEPFINDSYIIQTEDINIELKAWRSKLKIIKPRIVYDVAEVGALNFMPMIKKGGYTAEKAVNIAISFVIKKYGDPIVINGVYSYSQPYAIINDFNINKVKNNIVTLIWPTFCNCGCCKSGCQCLRINNVM